MVHAFVSLLAAAEEEKSKTPFYIVGCLFGVWAIALFAIGQKSETFPGTPGAARLLGGVSVVLCVASAGMALYVA
jgi:hypothetical protein